MGLRLPLDSLPWSAPEDRLAIDELDPFAPRAPLPAVGRRGRSSVRRRPLARTSFPAGSGAAITHRHRRLAAASRRGTCPRRRPGEPSRGQRASRRRAVNRPPASSARRCASSRAAVSCTSSCRRSRRSRTTSIWSAPSKRRRARSACACCSKAIRRRTTRGCRISSSLRIRA